MLSLKSVSQLQTGCAAIADLGGASRNLTSRDFFSFLNRGLQQNATLLIYFSPNFVAPLFNSVCVCVCAVFDEHKACLLRTDGRIPLIPSTIEDQCPRPGRPISGSPMCL